MIKKILLSIPQAPANSSETALALDLASHHGAEITGFTTVDTEHIAMQVPKAIGYYSYHIKEIEILIEAAQADADGAMNALKVACDENKVKFRPASALSSEGSLSLASVWRFHDVCVVPTNLWVPGASQLASTESILQLVAMGLRPLIAVPRTIPNARPSKVLVALSGSLESAKALKHFIQLQLYPGIPVHLVAIGDPKSGESCQELMDQASDFLKAHGYPVTIACLEDTGDRVSSLLAEAESSGSGMFVIGSSYKRLLMLKRFGKHALGLLERSPLPVFLSH